MRHGSVWSKTTNKIRQNLAQASWLRSALLFALFAAFALPSRANTLSDNITVTGGTVVEDGDNVIITYTRSAIQAAGGVGRLEFTAGQATADVLAVGGGGGGGRSVSDMQGAGAGGGAGGFVEVTGLTFKGTYDIVVGAGGSGHATRPSAAARGASGGDTTIEQDGSQVAGIAVAKGGGGGGAGGTTGTSTGSGLPGGSGGGGSATLKTLAPYECKAESGGAGESGQGNAGGAGNIQYVGGGGGGAGGIGTTPVKATKKATDPAYGGIGKQSAITGKWYAGGGAGADTHSSGWMGSVDGSQGGGGSGGSGANTGSRNAEANTGSGGGGGNYDCASGNGADGIVVVRLRNYIAGGVVIPTVPAFVYDGTDKTAAIATEYYTLSGEVVKKNVGNYSMTVTLTAAGVAIGWDDPTDPRISGNTATVTWSIAKKPVAKPETTATSFTYTGSSQQGYKTSADYTLGGVNMATDAGTYSVTATLKDSANTEWADGAATTRTDLSWTINKAEVAKPAKAFLAAYTYDGTGKTGYVESPSRYTLDENNIRTNAATYVVTATLVDAANYKWAGGVANPRNDLDWTIKSKVVDESVLVPKTGLAFDNTEQVAYESSSTEFTLSGNRATNAGNYVMTATLNNPVGFTNYVWSDTTSTPQTRNWSIAPKSILWPPAGALASYTYAANTLRQPIPPSDWYERSGIGGATNVGVYACTASLKYNDGVVTNVVWSDASAADKTWDWEIVARQITPPTIGSFTYAESPKGTPTEQTVLTIDANSGYVQSAGDELTQKYAGSYSFTIRLKDTENYTWSDSDPSPEKSFSWSIAKADNVIGDITLKDWQVGDTSPHVPSCASVKFGPVDAVQYAWGLTKTGTVWKAWSEGVPTEAGTYYLRASVADAVNWNAAKEFKRFCVWKNPADVFTDFADITITGTVAGKPVEISLSEAVLSGKYAVSSGLPGFEYMRTGVNASELRFVLTNAVKTADQLLPFTNRTWNAGGVSKVWVQIPAGVASPVTIRMYWHAADGNAQSDNYPEDVGTTVASATTAFSLVNREGSWIDYWTKDATISDTAHLYNPANLWPTESDVTPAELKSGTVTRQVLRLPLEEPFVDLQTAPGSYVIAYSRAETAGERFDIFGGNQKLEYTIRLSNTYGDLGGTSGGRILLGNNDTNADYPISGQAYYQTDPSGGTYWEHSSEAPLITLPNLGTGINHTLYQVTGETTNVLWRTSDMRLGSLYPNNGNPNTGRNYLPWSSTCQPRTSATAEMKPSEVTYLVMRNIAGAAIYSPCYTNGIGTIYFDAVNGWKDDAEARVVVEIATKTSKGEVPTDENCRGGDDDDPYYYLTHDAEGNVLQESEDCWEPVTPTVLLKRWDGSTFAVDGTQTSLPTIKLGVTVGGKNNEFYRIVAPVDVSGFCRFRIRRPVASSGSADMANLILLDNVVASPPAMYAEMSSIGSSDEAMGRTGKQALGWAGALGTAFPSIRDTAVTGRGAASYVITPGISYDTGLNFIASARFNYRWRYLNQKTDPVWKTLYINHEAATGVEGEILDTVGAMELDGKVGDLEWYYDLTLQAPAYKYVDYSGCGVDKPVMDYEESRTSVTSRCASASALASGGTDWFVRLREGESPYEQLVLRTDCTDSRAEIQMELISDHVWRGYFKTVDPIEGGFRYRIEPRNLQVNGDEHYNFSTNYWYVDRDASQLPVSAVLELDGDTNSWSRIPCDATTGYLMFQVDDSTKSITIVHADYQDCDLWNDAKNNDVFKGNSMEDARKSGVSPRMREFDETFATWTATPSTDPENWTETFEAGASQEFAPYVSFGTARTLRAWTSGPGMFVYQWFKDNTVKSELSYVRQALQMEGCGKGWLQFPVLTDATRPRGLGSVNFKARLGQFITPDDDLAFAEYPEGDTDVSQNYCFVTLSAFDTNESKDFSGDASLSLFAYYRMRRGAYEIRFEQCKANASKGPDNAKTLSLYRWTADSAGKVLPVLLAAVTNTTISAVKTKTGTGYYTPMYISCSSDANETVIRAGVWSANNTGIAYNNHDSDNSYRTAISGKNFYSIFYRDRDDKRLKRGAYGVLSTNCKGVFLRPHVGASPVTSSTSFPSTTVKRLGNAAITFPTLASCRGDLEDSGLDGIWNISYGRMEAFVTTTDYLWGVRAATDISQKLALQISPHGENKWTTAETFEINGFGATGNAGNPYSHRFDRTADFDVRLRVEGELDDPRTDIIIDDVEVTQWRSGEYGDRDTTSYVAGDAEYGWRTNFIFTSAWVLNDGSASSVLLSPKRTLGWTANAKACAIRSPLMDGAGSPKRGIGLGLIAFEYRNAQTNANLLIQIATNDVGSSATGYDTIDDEKWTTVTNVDFSAMSADERKQGNYACYLGLHGVKGLMRIVADPKVVEAVSGANYLDASAYGEVEITHVYCRDEPPIDLSAWWGWNLQTTDHTNRQYLVDNLRFGTASGLSIGLNRGVKYPEDAIAENDPSYAQQMPFVQTPSFLSNTVGEVTFRARKYDPDETAPYAEIVLYGATVRPGSEDLVWKCSATDRPLATFVVSNTTYTTYTYKTRPGESYKAFRFGVAGIEDVDERTRGMSSRGESASPVRVLVDEILVSEAVRPTVGFRYCRPFRNAIAESGAIADILSCDEQPIAGDSWSVQAEIEVRLLPDELDLKTHKPRVFFHWYEGLRPWGYANWRDNAKAKEAELSLAEGETMVFRGSYIDSPGAIVLPTTDPLSYVQYAAEVVYYDTKGNCITSVLDTTEWRRPEWYAPIDLNATYGGSTGAFAAYNILESVAPNRAWINEVNVFDGRNSSFYYLAATNQYVEIAVPLGQSLKGWTLSCIANNYRTNTVCAFGDDEGVAASKTANMTNNYVFLTVQSPESAKKGWLSPARGEVDGTWRNFDGSLGELDETHPIGLILTRPSGIVEHEIAFEGTNTWAGTDYAARYSLTNFVAKVRSGTVESTIYAAGNEYSTPLSTSLGVTNVAALAEEDWTKGLRKTPGSCNEGQVIPEDYAIYPSGEMLIIYAQISGLHLRQTVGDVTNSVETALVAVKKDSDGTNIVYNLDTWYEIESITENNVPAPGVAGHTGTFTFTAGRNQSKNVTVVAKARPRSDLAETYGLTPDNRYTPAVLSWLDGGTTMMGEFRNPGVICLPTYKSYRGTYRKEMTLTEAYWLDIDPTGTNWVFWAGWCDCPRVKETHFSPDATGYPRPDPLGPLVKTNITMGVFAVITNETTDVGDADYAKNWSPYMLRGLTPGETSYNYTTAGDQTWTSVTFKVTGDIQNGKASRVRWIPMRYFVFGKDSFDANHKSSIDIPEPYSSSSEGAAAGWLDYPGCQVFYCWAIDTRLRPTTIELLCPTNALDKTW